jgi:hypothetical protein
MIHTGDIWSFLQSAWILFWLAAAAFCLIKFVFTNRVVRFIIIAIAAYIFLSKIGVFVP